MNSTAALDDRAAWDRMLRRFADDTRRHLEGSSTPYGQLVAEHIGRQLDQAGSTAYNLWFNDPAARGRFDQASVLAAVAGSDVTRPSRTCEACRSVFGATADRVAELANTGDLLYGRMFPTFGALEDLYMHAEAGRHYTYAELCRRGNGLAGTEQIARVVSDAIIGHDSFNAGFGRHRLKPLLAKLHGGMPENYTYPTSLGCDGFLVQALDRLEGLEAGTMIRYVTEGVLDRNEPLSAAIITGVIDNAAFLVESYDGLLHDARAAMDGATFDFLITFPGLQDFVRKLKRLNHVASELRLNARAHDGCYQLKVGNDQIRLDSLEAVRLHLPRALGDEELDPLSHHPQRI